MPLQTEEAQLNSQKFLRLYLESVKVKGQKSAKEILARVHHRYSPNFTWPRHSNIVELPRELLEDRVRLESLLADLSDLSETSSEIVEPKKERLTPFNYPLEIIHEDEDLIVINKSDGISMHPGPGNYDNTIVNALINYNGNNLSSIGNELRPGIVHRIDKDTSGLIVIAKNNLSHENLSNQFSKHTISRVYQALVWGKIRPRTGKIETFITRSSRNRQMMEVSLKKGKKAITNYKTLEIFENDNVPTLSLIECKLETGRTHQIRVHMKFKGTSLLGDNQYGKKNMKFKSVDENFFKILSNFKGQALHAKHLGFIHPTSDKFISFDSKLPNDFEKLLNLIENLCG